MTTRDEAKDVATQKQEYARGLLRVDPGITNSDINHRLEKRFKAGSLNDKTIDGIRAELGWKRVGRGRGAKLVRIDEHREEAKPDEKTPTTERVLGSSPATPQTGPQPTVQPAVVTATTRRADEHRFNELVIEMQAVMNRLRILIVSIPRQGDPHIQEVSERDVRLPRTDGTAQH